MKAHWAAAWALASALAATAALASVETPPATIAADVLRSAASSEITRAGESRVQRVVDSGGNTPIIESIEARGGFQTLPEAEQRYRLRFNPRGFGETGAQSRLKSAVHARVRTEATLTLLHELKARYETLIRLKIASDRRKALKNLQLVRQESVRLARRQVGASQLQAKNLIDAESKVDDANLDVARVDDELAASERKIAQLMDQSGKGAGARRPVSFKKFPSPRELLAGVEQAMRGEAGQQEIELKHLQQQANEALSDYETDKAKGYRFVKFVGVGVKHEPVINQDSLTFEVGLTLPFIQSDRIGTSRKLARALEQENAVAIERTELADKTAELRRKLARAVGDYELLDKSEASRKLGLYLSIYQRHQGGNVQSELLVREKLLDRELKLIEHRKEALEAYVELLAQTGALAERPLKNYLSRDLEAL